MTVITLEALATALGVPGPVERGRVVVDYMASRFERYTAVDGATVTFPATIGVDIVDGTPDAALDVPPTGGACCARIQVVAFRDAECRDVAAQLERFVTIPDSGPVDFGDLVDVDPDTYTPAPAPASILDTVRSELLDGVELRRVTQDEYDTLPTPRPTDVLYVITPS